MVPLSAQQIVWVVVDSYYAWSGGSFLLHVRPISEAGFCTGGVDEDLDGFLDCGDPDCVSDVACVPAGTSGTTPRRGVRRRRRRRTREHR